MTQFVKHKQIMHYEYKIPAVSLCWPEGPPMALCWGPTLGMVTTKNIADLQYHSDDHQNTTVSSVARVPSVHQILWKSVKLFLCTLLPTNKQMLMRTINSFPEVIKQHNFIL